MNLSHCGRVLTRQVRHRTRLAIHRDSTSSDSPPLWTGRPSPKAGQAAHGSSSHLELRW